MTLAANEQLTIVLTLKDRTPFTHRWMRYMNDLKCPYPILVADGGADELVEAHLKQQDNYPQLHYTYIRYPFDKDYGTYYQKLADVVDRVSTPYLLLADNDDFYLLEHVPTFIRFLDEDESFVSCGGTPIVLRLLSDDNKPAASPSAGHYTAVADDRPKAVTADEGVDRLCYFMTNVKRYYLWSSWYQVHRSSAVKQGANFVREHEFADPVSFEIHMHVCLLLNGKYKQFEEPFLVGQHGASQLTSELDSRANLVERFVMSNAFGDIHRSLEAFAPALSEGDKERIHKSVARWFAESAIGLYPPPRAEGVKAALRAALRRKPASRPAVRLPAIEKYILDPAP